ncbi:hypothetical protein [Devosia faecipullorum]|uniref:hypothetical protein n=1 Tax=Devosia faecipullorum TaxID=2755039 RepID=UPI00187BA287|nr:hypothetical protein [Devosia faecipullorum]MBE7731796.1 hypothetical protein [Devosia faecipullorum]
MPPLWASALMVFGGVISNLTAYVMEGRVEANILTKLATRRSLGFHSLPTRRLSLPDGILPKGEHRRLRNFFYQDRDAPKWSAFWYQADRRDRGKYQKSLYGAAILELAPVGNADFLVRRVRRHFPRHGIQPASFLTTPVQTYTRHGRSWDIFGDPGGHAAALTVLDALGEGLQQHVDAIFSNREQLSVVIANRRRMFSISPWQLWPFSADIALGGVHDDLDLCQHYATALSAAHGEAIPD